MATLGFFASFLVAGFVIFLAGDFLVVPWAAALLVLADTFFGVVFTFFTVAFTFLLAEEGALFTGVLAAAFFRGTGTLLFFTEEREPELIPFAGAAATFFVPTGRLFVAPPPAEEPFGVLPTLLRDNTFFVDVDTTPFLDLVLTAERDGTAAALPDETLLTELTRFFTAALFFAVDALPFPLDLVVLTIALNDEGQGLTAIATTPNV